MATTCMVTPGKNKDIRVTESRKLLWELGKVIDIKSISPKVKLFTIETKFDAKKLCEDAEKNGYLFDLIDTNLVKFAFTEKRSKSQIDELVEFLNSYNG